MNLQQLSVVRFLRHNSAFFFIQPERKPLSTTECKDVKVWLVKVARCVLRSNIKVYHE